MKTLLAALLIAAGVRTSVPIPEPTPPTDRERVLAVAASEVGVKEKTGRNDGEVDKYLVSVGLGGSRAPYCAAFVYWVGKEALGDRNPYPRSAWSPSFLSGGKRVTSDYHPQGGEAFGIWFASKKRIAHTGLIESREGNYLITIEGNTSSNAAVGSAADREGHGVYRKRRHLRTVHSAHDWLSK